MGKARDSFQDITEEEGFAVRVTEEWEETKFCEVRTDSGERGKNGTKVIIDNVDGGHEGVSRDNGME